MEPDGIHELTAAYAVDALDPDDEREYEEHLRHCARCRDDLAALQETAAALAYAVEAPEPPRRLLDRILDAAAAERSNVVPLRRRALTPALGAAAAVAAGAAIGLGIWASSLAGSLDDEREAARARGDVIALLVQSGATHVPVEGAAGTLVVGPDGDAALVFSHLPPAPEGQTYQAWVIEGNAPRPAGVFEGGGETSVVRLEEPVAAGTTVAVTVEPEGGVEVPTTEPFAVARTA